jgi:hypothetical protein
MNETVTARKMSDPFDCVCCGQRFTPAESQWIFYDLCTMCAGPFYEQRDAGRVAFLSLSRKSHHENSREWATANAPCRCATWRGPLGAPISKEK